LTTSPSEKNALFVAQSPTSNKFSCLLTFCFLLPLDMRAIHLIDFFICRETSMIMASIAYFNDSN
jgi:hypothetical protein